MPFNANAARRHRIPKQRNRVTSWAGAGLRRRAVSQSGSPRKPLSSGGLNPVRHQAVSRIIRPWQSEQP